MIVALNSKNPADLPRFQLFVHHRAYRKLGQRVLKFSTHWGRLPFDILAEHIDTRLKQKTFQFKYQDLEFHNLIQSYVSPETDISCTSVINSRPVYVVNAMNASQWIEALKELWLRLQSYLLVESSDEGKSLMVNMDSPTTRIINDIVTVMFVLEALMPMFEYLLSAQGVSQVFARAGELDNSFTSSHCTHSFTELDQYHLSRNKKTTGSSEPGEEHNAFSDNDEQDLEFALTGEDCESHNYNSTDQALHLSQGMILPHRSIEHLLRAMKSVLSWQTSCRHVFRKAARFQHKETQWRLSHFQYRNQALTPSMFDVDTVLPLIRAWQGPSSRPCGAEDAEAIISRTGKATVHAEAALMHWIATVKVRSPSFIFEMIHYSHLLTSRCRMLVVVRIGPLVLAPNLAKCVGSSITFTTANAPPNSCSPGLMGLFPLGFPPPGLPDAILIEIRDVLLTTCKTFTPRRSKPSTSGSSRPIDVDISNFLQLGFLRLRGSNASK